MFIGIINWIPERVVPPGNAPIPGPGVNNIITETGINMVDQLGVQLIIE